MRQLRVVGLMVGVIAAGGCATGGGLLGGSHPDAAQPAGLMSVRDAAMRDSVVAQTFADREGPGARIVTEVTSTAGGVRHLRARFHLDDDAYVVVGHVDPDGVLRIVFPIDPGDDGFVRGDRTYMTSEFLAGFNDEFRYRASDASLVRNYDVRRDSYDGGLGYVFVVASWRPMRLDQFTTNGRWDSFEISDVEYLRDPRPAVAEFASLLAGDNREAYTLKYAPYFNTVVDDYATNYGGYGDSGYYGYCSGYSPFGYASSAFGGIYSPYTINSRYGDDFNYRGTNYFYNPVGDCYTTGNRGLGYYGGVLIAATPPTAPAKPRAFNADNHRRPPEPRPEPAHHFPQNGESPKPSNAPQNAQFSPEYRQRGLMTTDGNSSAPPTSAPRVQFRANADGQQQQARPSIQEMTTRRGETTNDGANMRARARSADDGSRGQAWVQLPQQQQARQSQQQARQAQHVRPATTPRSEQSATTSAPRPEPVRSAPPPRMEAPRVEAPPAAAVRTGPPPPIKPPVA